MKGRAARRPAPAAAERIQKLLATRGIGSRRQVEAWIAAGRVTVNGRAAVPGQPVNERDDIRLDGRRLRLRQHQGAGPAGLVYHRPPREQVRATSAGESLSSLERLPAAGGRRWIPVSPLAAGDGGLELFLGDGALAAALARHVHELPCEYGVRVQGSVDDAVIRRLLELGADSTAGGGTLDAVVLAGGEGTNHWLNVSCRGLRPRDLRPLFEGIGLTINRVLRTSLGPIAMGRRLARGRSRPLTEEELAGLRAAAGVTEPAGRRNGRGRPA